ncbi:GlsB/YeaQ/YmgE family stress response membrane protein [Lysobacter sp. TY2-98]|uniref:GlsB/YeaQ/YmgE family stress response membrane protein n=1 Tax=Lysobacter sp. TY2-98 TaxID=2290922 RepID=UPI000E1FF27A|nr:GlsB/YeaQ/YmgE family stress response membrane protein [Lysobacter sp. TY2-98]AXK71417.1 GlsB/YeaQ/YmgE family stress response membrane protein [Lysobacter sp. TY2-98]
MFHGFFGYLIGGAIIGVLARLLKPGPDPMGLIMTILIGAGGAAIGGYFVRTGFLAWVAAIVSAIVLIAIYQRITRRTPPRDQPMR